VPQGVPPRSAWGELASVSSLVHIARPASTLFFLLRVGVPLGRIWGAVFGTEMGRKVRKKEGSECPRKIKKPNKTPLYD
jgi:hypothetical protein